MEPRRSFARKNGRARWRTDRLRAVRAGEAHAIAGQLIEVWRVMLAASVTRQVVDAEVIGQDEDDVRGSGNGASCYERQEDED